MGIAMLGAVKLFDFDEVDERLVLVPIAARRALDAAGRRLSLEGWQSLPHPDREALVRAGSTARVDVGLVYERVSCATPAAAAIPKSEDASVATVPEVLSAALGQGRPLPVSVWTSLSALERYALVKTATSRRPERLERAYVEIVGRSAYSTHVAPGGGARMVRISEKAETLRRARAEGEVRLSPELVQRLLGADAPKGDVLGTARLAAIQAAKRTSEWIPLCHPVRLTHVAVSLDVEQGASRVRIRADVEAYDRTGVEMEAMVAVSAAALTVYDMLKGLDRAIVIGPTRLIEKSGGKSGDFRREDAP